MEEFTDMTKTFRLLLVLIGVLLFAVGLLLGQQMQRSKFDKYLRPGTVTQMDLLMLNANIGALSSFLSGAIGRLTTVPNTQTYAPTLFFRPACTCFEAYAPIPRGLMKQPLDQVREKLLDLVATAYPSLK